MAPRRPNALSEPGSTPVNAGFDPADLLARIPEPILCTDPEGRLLWLNTAAEELTGYAATDLLGHSFAVLAAPAERMRLARHFLRELRHNRASSFLKTSLVSRDGRTVWVGLRVSRIHTLDGKPRFVACVQDLHDTHFELDNLRRKVRDLSVTTEEAKRAARLKGEFLATISHEIRTPMNGVMGMTQLLLESDLDRDQRRFAETISASGEALLTLINDTLDYSKIEAGRLEIEAIDFDLRVTMDGVAAVLSPRVVEKGVQLSCTVHHEVPSYLKGDPGRLRQVLLNLGSNAIKFTEKGEVAIRVELAKETAAEVTLRFSVKDTGIGMTEEQLSSLFQAYSQADVSIGRRFGGTGLGLAICRRLVTLMGGEVGVSSEAGKGSTFWFEVPLVKRPGGAAAAPLPKVELGGLRVLVADSAPSMRLALTEMLSSWGCESVEAEDGETALALLHEGMRRDQPFRVVLVDMSLPGLDGEALAKAVRADETIETPLLMLLTNLGRRGDAMRAKELGYSAYLLKPVQQSHLYDALVEMVHEGGKVEVATAPIITRHSVAEKRRQRTRVLLVEDNPVNQLVAVAALRRMGYQSQVAATGQKALDLCAQQAFDIVFMDIQMPDMDGFQATAEIRKREGDGRHTPIVAVTANALQGDREKCLAAGMDDYLTKPIDLDSMCAMVDRWTRPDEPAVAPREPSTAPVPRHDPTMSGILRVRLAETSPTTGAGAQGAPPRHLHTVDELADEGMGPIIDTRRLDSASMGSPELKALLIKAFLTHARPRLAKLRDFVAQGDAAGIQFEGHAMRGMCATLGATRCADLFGRIEKLGADRRLEPVAPLLDHADVEIGLVEDELGPMSQAA